MKHKSDSNRSKRSQLSRRQFARKMALTGAALPVAGSLVSAAGWGPDSEAGKAAGTDRRGGIHPGREAGSRPEAPLRRPDSFSIHLFSKHLQFVGYDEMAYVSAGAGVDGVDLTVRPGGHVLPEKVERDLPRAAKAIRNAGLELTMITTRITDPEDPVTETILKTASGLGVFYYRPGYYHYDHKKSIPANLEAFRGKLSGLAELNEKYRMHGAYQNHSGHYFGAAVWDLWEVIQDMDPRWTGCQYDIRHAVVEGANSWHLGLELLKDHIRCMVIKDFHWSRQNGEWRVKNVPVGEGMVDFAAYFGKLEELAVSGPLSLHIEYPLFPDRNMPPGQKKSMALDTIRNDVESLRKLLPAP